MFSAKSRGIDFRLTLREVEVLRLVSLGFCARPSALRLNIAQATVQRHIENARNRPHVVTYVVKAQLI